MPNITVYIKNAIWTRILRESGGNWDKARQRVKALIEDHYAKKKV